MAHRSYNRAELRQELDSNEYNNGRSIHWSLPDPKWSTIGRRLYLGLSRIERIFDLKKSFVSLML